MIKRFSRHNILVVALLLLTACKWDESSISIQTTGTWQEIGLANINTFQIEYFNNSLYVGSEYGIFKKSLLDKSWKHLGPDSATVYTFILLSDKEILAPAFFNSDSSTIAKSTDGGSSWISYRNGYGSEEFRSVPVTSAHKPNSDIIYGMYSFTIGRSTNRGMSWEPVNPAWWDAIGVGKFLTIDKDHTSLVWAGGSNAVGEAYLTVSKDDGNKWIDIETLGKGSDINDIVLHSSNSKVLVIGSVGGKNGIHKSNNNGATWTSTLSGDLNIYTIEKSKQDKRIIFASGYNDQRTLWFAVSPDFGDSWQKVTYEGGPTNLTVNDIAIEQSGKSEILYFATSAGIYSYRIEDLIK